MLVGRQGSESIVVSPSRCLTFVLLALRLAETETAIVTGGLKITPIILIVFIFIKCVCIFLGS
jgi:hypothetical protein